MWPFLGSDDKKTAASYYPEFSLTIAISPPDFVMEGFYRDGKDGMAEKPGDNESSVSWQEKPLPYLPYAYRHPEYWKGFPMTAPLKAGCMNTERTSLFLNPC